MQITLTLEQEKFLRAQLERGQYRTPEEVVSQALKLLEEQETLKLVSPIAGSESAKQLLVEKLTQLRTQQARSENTVIDGDNAPHRLRDRESLSQDIKNLFKKTDSIAGIEEITEADMAAEIEAYRSGQ
ncbi:type II toxin-antitoxin system ParD family antitoxin [Roseofilum sp. BLCC_M91]|uniref:Type II toxin-antitoxin system ParD family antitoxin n=1 Tax=Roseofilum halophilum BLCC-M91 TaxID=3022259 RepID=A0ABT7BKL1_9CYAN|nr:type II toxin-antitoxin system ParD family antitoxin [Roseofilum halophilum]MDJ1179726.1 type II toxin-antitoxin system ParD family antitoxin [Roseofilum halophilum BLCC-M91]